MAHKAGGARTSVSGGLLIPTDIKAKIKVGSLANWGFDKEMTIGGPARGVKVVCAT